MFGQNSVLNLPFQAAAKTGTAGDPRGADAVNVYDNWTLGYTPDLAVGTWVGNADYTPMLGTSGTTGAAPVWSAFMQYAVPPVAPNNTPTSFSIPSGIIEKIICSLSGTEPSNWCRGGQRSEFYVSDQPPLPASQDILRQTQIDTWTGFIAGNACPDFTMDDLVMNVNDPFARKWLRSSAGHDWLDQNGLPDNPFFAPERECSADDPRPILEFTNLKNNDVITDPTLIIKGIIHVTKGGITGWRLEAGSGENPQDWTVLVQGSNKIEGAADIFTWDMKDVTSNKITLRIYLLNGEEFYAEKRVTLSLNLPTPTPRADPDPNHGPADGSPDQHTNGDTDSHSHRDADGNSMGSETTGTAAHNLSLLYFSLARARVSVRCPVSPVF